MGIKSLSLQMIPWCFHVMGSTTACHHADPPASPAATKVVTATTKGKASLCIRLIRADGRVEVFHRSVSASELMKEHPMHLVCRSDAFTIGQRIPALAEGEHLQPGHAYFLLPVHLFQSVLSFVTLASSFARAAAAASSNVSASPLLQRPFDVQRTPSGKLQIRVCDEFIRRVQEAQEAGQRGGGVAGQGSGGGGRVCTTAALEKDYQQLVVGCKERQWKPKLETIRESERRRGKLASVGGAGGALDGIRRRRKKGHQHQVEPNGSYDQKQQLQEKKQQQKQEQSKKQIQKVSTTSAKHLNSSPNHNHSSKGKKVVACRL